MKKGDYVQTWTYAGTKYTCTGRIEEANLTFGRVAKAGPKAIEILWESGSRTRVRRDDPWLNGPNGMGIQAVDADVVPAAKKAMRGVR